MRSLDAGRPGHLEFINKSVAPAIYCGNYGFFLGALFAKIGQSENDSNSAASISAGAGCGIVTNHFDFPAAD